METSVERTDRISGYMLHQARKSATGAEDLEQLKHSSTVYIGNMSFYTTEEQVYELFSKVGPINRVIMGLDRFSRTPCGFCFIEYADHESSLRAVRYLNGTKLDDRIIQIDRDPGFVEGRQFGRGARGGQRRDEFRQDFDPGRGGYGGQAREQPDEKPAPTASTTASTTAAPAPVAAPAPAPVSAPAAVPEAIPALVPEPSDAAPAPEAPAIDGGSGN